MKVFKTKHRTYVLALVCLLFSFSFKSNSKVRPLNDCDSYQGIEKVLCLVNGFKATLSASQRANLAYEYTKENVEIWSNLPASISPRLGLKMGDLNEIQLLAAKELLKGISGKVANEGWEEIQQIWMADNFLNTIQTGDKFGAGNYYIAFLGKPSSTGTFEIIMTGHHYTIANTYKNGKLVGATPRFEAVEPYSFISNGNSYNPISQERNAMAALLNELTDKQLSEANMSEIFTNILLQPLMNWSFPKENSGLQLNALSSAQKQLVVNVIKTYTDDLAKEDADMFLSKYVSEINDTFILFSGTKTLTSRNDYFRIAGPHVWIELVVQRGVVMRDDPYHFHSIWRDRESDYGGQTN
jgi:hypothetical protein